jgi:hypothetical protein
MVRLEVNASGESPDGLLKLVTVIAPGSEEGAPMVGVTGASRIPATGSRSGSGPVAASEKEHPLHVEYCTVPAHLPETLGR